MKLREDMNDLGVFYFDGKLMRDRDGWFVRTGGMTIVGYEPVKSWLLRSPLIPVICFLLVVVLTYLRYGR